MKLTGSQRKQIAIGVLKEAKKIEQDIIVANHFNISSGLLDKYKFKEIEIEEEEK